MAGRTDNSDKLESGAKRPTQFPPNCRPATQLILDAHSKCAGFSGRLEMQTNPLTDLLQAQ